MMEKTIVFVDIDGTVAQWLPTTTPEELVEPGYFQNLPPYTQMVENVRYLIRHGVQVYSLSAYMQTKGDPVAEKNLWLDKYIPEIPNAHRLFCPCDASKWDTVCKTVDPTDKTFVLLDDYSSNLHQWEEDSSGAGVAIKVMNGINGTKGSWTGARFYNAGSPKELLVAIICHTYPL